MIQLSAVTKVYNAGKQNEFTALRNISMSIDPGRVTVLKGPSGSGKTTLLSIIGCMIRPTAGRVLVNGKEITSLPERFLTGTRRMTFGFVFQQFNLIKGLSVIENVMLPAFPCGDPYGTMKKRTLQILDILKIEDKAKSKIEWLSGGEAQRVSIARALMNDPEVIIADEPTAHLDTKLSEEFMDILGEMKSRGKTVLIASHDPIVYDCKIIDRVVEMRDGTITGSENRA
ncbi:MAG: ABC transporter ATP-binding protein [Thermodesulfovibrionales bacterium]|nr:ABC transporter ATP-binding protein [Thermodesulfovibrionales bacterium]